MKPLALTFSALLLALPALGFAATPVNINTADASTLAESLDGVGLAKAQAIVAWRDANGRFDSADQLTSVKGIGQSLVDRNRDSILLDGAKTGGKAGKATKKPRPARGARSNDADTAD